MLVTVRVEQLAMKNYFISNEIGEESEVTLLIYLRSTQYGTGYMGWRVIYATGDFPDTKVLRPRIIKPTISLNAHRAILKSLLVLEMYCSSPL